MESVSQTTGGGDCVISIAFRRPMVSSFNSFLQNLEVINKNTHEFVKLDNSL